MSEQLPEVTDVASSGDGATSAVRAAEGGSAGIATPATVDDQGDIYNNLYQPTTLGEDQQNTLGDMMGMRQVVRDGQVIFGEKPKPIDAFKVKNSTDVSISGAGGDAWKIIERALRSALGTPYVWGGEHPGGFDCSGLVQWAFAKAGIKMPRLSYDQINKGKKISMKNLRPGDLIGWDYTGKYPGADHIAVYIGGGKIIEAPRPGRSVQISGLYSVNGHAPYAVRVL